MYITMTKKSTNPVTSNYNVNKTSIYLLMVMGKIHGKCGISRDSKSYVVRLFSSTNSTPHILDVRMLNFQEFTLNPSTAGAAYIRVFIFY